MILIQELWMKLILWKKKNSKIWKSFSDLKNHFSKDLTKLWKWKNSFLIYKIKIIPCKNKSDNWTRKTKIWMIKTMTWNWWVKTLIMTFFTWKKQFEKVKLDMPQLIKPWACSKIELIKLWTESKTKTKKLVVLSKSWQKLEIKLKSSDNKRLNMTLTLTS